MVDIIAISHPAVNSTQKVVTMSLNYNPAIWVSPNYFYKQIGQNHMQLWMKMGLWLFYKYHLLVGNCQNLVQNRQ